VCSSQASYCLEQKVGGSFLLFSGKNKKHSLRTCIPQPPSLYLGTFVNLK
jgi:hypothetical protein